jgi:hypothetical protein
VAWGFFASLHGDFVVADLVGNVFAGLPGFHGEGDAALVAPFLDFFEAFAVLGLVCFTCQNEIWAGTDDVVSVDGIKAFGPWPQPIFTLYRGLPVRGAVKYN